ncbi:MAG: T9SS type A sorting domain-containing protein [Ignavibacteriaceae bacterium]
MTTGGSGQVCMNCHHARANANTAVAAGWKSYFGPHEGPQTDMFFGENGYQFGDSSIAGLNTHVHLSDACVTCHMSTDTVDAKATNLLGGHTWKMSGTDSAGVATDNTTACQSCHGPITDFDEIPAPYDYAGIANGGPIPGVQTEVKALLTKLASLLPDSVIANPSSPTVGKGLSQTQLGALYDYIFVSKDRSMGIHNAKYTFALLTRAIGTLTGVKVISNKIPKTYALEQNYPNPFNPTTIIKYDLPKAGQVTLKVYDILGREVATLYNGNQLAGTYNVSFDASQLASGVYFYQLKSGDYVSIKKMVLLK